MRHSATILLVFGLAGCWGKPSLDDQSRRWETFVSHNRFGETADYWLTKRSIFSGQLDKVAVIFGVLDDYEMCRDLADLYMSRYPDAEYVCLPAN